MERGRREGGEREERGRREGGGGREEEEMHFPLSTTQVIMTTAHMSVCVEDTPPVVSKLSRLSSTEPAATQHTCNTYPHNNMYEPTVGIVAALLWEGTIL